MPRKNGKTELAAALCLYHLLADGEVNGQVYSAAADKQQASIVFNVAAAMIRADPELVALVNVIDSVKRIVHYASGSYYQALSSDAKTKHGFNASAIICDELAQWPKRELYDVLTTATGARAQPLTLVISTQSSDPLHVMSELVEYGRKVEAGVFDDPAFHSTIYAAPLDADPWDEAVWHACNPALGDFRSIEEMRNFAAKAKRIPAAESAFRNLYLNQPVDADKRFLSSADWDACATPVDLDRLEGRPCYGGLDLSSVQDLTAYVLVFPSDDEPTVYDVLAWFWTAGDTLADRAERDKAPYGVWRDQGLLIAPPGRAIDRAFVAHTIAESLERFDVRTIAADRWQLAQLEKVLADEGVEAPIEGFGQGFRDMAPAVDALEAAILDARIRHGGHPVMRWCAANATVTTDPAGNRKLDKSRSTGRIDGLVALTMAIGIAERSLEPVLSPYERDRPEGFLII